MCGNAGEVFFLQYRHHHFPNNITLRDVQRRRIFKKGHRERSLITLLNKNDILPPELKRLAWEEADLLPYDSGVKRPNFRCTVTGRARGNFNDFRVSRFIFRYARLKKK